jgi:hypothetical protein
MEGFMKSAEKASMSRDGAQSLRQLMTEYEDVFRRKLGADPLANVRSHFYQAARRCRTRVYVISQVLSAAAEVYSAPCDNPCRAVCWPIGDPIRYIVTRANTSKTDQSGPSDVPPESDLTSLNPTIAHTK